MFTVTDYNSRNSSGRSKEWVKDVKARIRSKWQCYMLLHIGFDRGHSSRHRCTKTVRHEMKTVIMGRSLPWNNNHVLSFALLWVFLITTSQKMIHLIEVMLCEHLLGFAKNLQFNWLLSMLPHCIVRLLGGYTPKCKKSSSGKICMNFRTTWEIILQIFSRLL